MNWLKESLILLRNFHNRNYLDAWKYKLHRRSPTAAFDFFILHFLFHPYFIIAHTAHLIEHIHDLLVEAFQQLVTWLQVFSMEHAWHAVSQSTKHVLVTTSTRKIDRRVVILKQLNQNSRAQAVFIFQQHTEMRCFHLVARTALSTQDQNNYYQIRVWQKQCFFCPPCELQKETQH